MDCKDFAPSALVRHADNDLAVEAAGASQGFVDRLGPVGRRDHHQIGARLKPVHQRQQLRHQPLFGLPVNLVAFGGNRIDFVDE